MTKTKNRKDYQFMATNYPVARFFYKGNHTHPVRRTIIVIKQTAETITGYELREGATIRSFQNSPVKSYRKDTIAKVNQVDSRCTVRRMANRAQLDKSTLRRFTLKNLIKFGA